MNNHKLTHAILNVFCLLILLAGLVAASVLVEHGSWLHLTALPYYYYKLCLAWWDLFLILLDK